MDKEILALIGYAASGIVAVSMTMNSIVKFRWINLCGAFLFATYGFLVGAYPVGFLNSFIFSVDIFYLIRIYNKKELFKTLQIRGDNKYLLEFLKFHNNDIQKFVPGFTYKPEINTVSFYILRNAAVAGIFLAHRVENDALKVGLDYVIPQYRDYKNGKYLYHRLNEYFVMAGYKSIVVETANKAHVKYLKRIGFSPKTENCYEIKLNT